MLRIFLLWLVGIALIVPYSINQLLFHAERDEYAFLIVAPLFWVFGFWGVVGPLIGAWRVHKLMSALDAARDASQIREAFERNEGREVIVDLIASEHGLPRFVARWLYDRVARKVQEEGSLQL